MTGYYSLIQYCPDLSRNERMNVGLVLVAGPGKARAEVVSDVSRVCRAFPAENPAWVANVVRSISARQDTEITEGCLCELHSLRHFAGTRAHEAQLTEPRGLKITETVDEAFADLWAKLVEERG